MKIKAFFSERWTKFLIALKKNPQSIPLIALTVSTLVFSLNLTSISNTTAKINIVPMGLCAFVAMLFMILSYVCMFSAFPKRQKANKLLIAIMLVMYAVVIFVDILYMSKINIARTREVSPIKITTETMYILKAYNALLFHIITVAITAVTVVLEPLIAKLLKKIKITRAIEEGERIEALELSEGE